MARERGLYRRKDSRFWWISLVVADGRRVCQSTGCVDRTAAEAFAVRLKSEALEARQQGLLGIVVFALEVVRRILNVAQQEWRWLRGVPKIQMLKEPRRRVRFLRREEAVRATICTRGILIWRT